MARYLAQFFFFRELQYYVSALSIPPLLIWNILTNEWSLVFLRLHFDWKTNLFILWMGLQIFLLNCALNLLVSLTSPATVVVTGELKNMGITVGSYFFFSDSNFDGWNVVGLSLSALGSISYAITKCFDQKSETTQETLDGTQNNPSEQEERFKEDNEVIHVKDGRNSPSINTETTFK